MSTGGSEALISNELSRYQEILTPPGHNGSVGGAHIKEQVQTAPLVWWDVKEELERTGTNVGIRSPFSHYGVLGHVPGQNLSSGKSEKPRKPVLLNTNIPWSVFLCGSQGSGKSHALSCILENCLLSEPDQVQRIGRNPKPLTGLVFHYDKSQSSGVCEAAYLSSHIPTTVLVSPSNFKNLQMGYSEVPGGNIKVEKLYLLPKYLDTARFKSLMAIGKGDTMPLYMQTIIKILRQMAFDAQGESGEVRDFNYSEFRQLLGKEKLIPGQQAPLNMRLDLLESFMNKNSSNLGQADTDHLQGTPGTLTIVDLTDPCVDSDSACCLFNVCLSVFLAQADAAKIVALDEAHNYMTDLSAPGMEFTESLVSSIRQQRHQGVRVVVATQEPSINTRLLDLCNITMVHRCTSPDWFNVLKQHLGALFLQRRGDNMAAGAEETRVGEEVSEGGYSLFRKIMRLELGQSLLFCPSAVTGIEQNIRLLRMHDSHAIFQTRQRVTADGGRDRLAGA